VGLNLGDCVGVAPAIGEAVAAAPEQLASARATSRPARPNPARCERGLPRSSSMPDRRNVQCVREWIVVGASLCQRPEAVADGPNSTTLAFGGVMPRDHQ
jgi:hypothetical protein